MRILILTFFVLNSYALTLKLDVAGSANKKGMVGVLVHSSEKSYPDKVELVTYNKFHKFSEFPVSIELPRGEYAVSVFHDENDSKKLDRNFLTAPTEAYGFSNDASATLSAPDYEDVKFKLDADKSILINFQNT